MLNRLKGVFESLRQNDVRYLVVGGIAAVLHGVPRATFDLDLYVSAEPANLTALLAAFEQAGLGTAALTSVDEILGNEITVFKDRVRIDVFITLKGLNFGEAWEHRRTMTYQGHPFFVVDKPDLIQAKRASGRQVDLEDLRILEGTPP